MKCLSGNCKGPYILLWIKETNLLDISWHLENYMSDICEDDNKSCNVGTSKTDGSESHITYNCLASKYSKANDATISNHKNTP